MSRQPNKTQTTGKHIGFGKVILFGEHFVVHGAPAIVAGISEYTDCALRVLPGEPGWKVVDNRPAVPGYKTSKAAEQREAHKLVFDHNKIDLTKNGLEITLAGPLVPSSGIGASASDCVALTRALDEMYGLGLNDHQVNHSAWVGEGGYHGTPSGVDNTAATFGGLLVYQRSKEHGPKFSRLPSRVPLFLVVVSTGITASTTKVVGDVRALKDAEPERFNYLVCKYQEMYKRAVEAVASGNVLLLGEIMSQTHILMQQLTVSCAELDDIVRVCLANGAIGAKMSGTGRGGIAVALVKDRAGQDRISEALKKDCAKSAKFIWNYTVAAVAESKL
jgi:mevalonate kinase